MNALEIARLVLYFLHEVWSIVVFGVTADKLYVSGLCYFKLKASNCEFLIAWGVIAFIIITAVVVWHCLSYFMSVSLPPKLEFIIFLFLTIWWLIAAIVASAAQPGYKISAGNTVVAFCWMLVFFSIFSAIVAFMDNKKGGDGGPSPTVEVDI